MIVQISVRRALLINSGIVLVPHLSPCKLKHECMIVATYTTYKSHSTYSSSSQFTRLCYCLLSNQVVRIFFENAIFYISKLKVPRLSFHFAMLKSVINPGSWSHVETHSCFPSSCLFALCILFTAQSVSICYWLSYGLGKSLDSLFNDNYNNLFRMFTPINFQKGHLFVGPQIPCQVVVNHRSCEKHHLFRFDFCMFCLIICINLSDNFFEKMNS